SRGVSQEKPRNVRVTKLSTEHMHSGLANLLIHIPRHGVCGVLIEKAKGFSRSDSIILKIPRSLRQRKFELHSLQLTHQEVLCFAEVQEFLDGSTILLDELSSVPAIQDFGLLKGGERLVRDEEFEVAVVEIG
ncbi:hypothetical protein APX70_03489, partial [Pseudomonas syringae pv. maculicola]